MGLIWSGRYISLFLAVQLAYLLHAVRATGKCDTVFKGFSDCLLRLGENMASYPQELEEAENLRTICTYWDDFHSCAASALADCQEGAADLWEQLKAESRGMEFRGSLFQLCGSGTGGARPGTAGGTAITTALSALVTWLAI